MNEEKEKYLSRFTNVADLIESSESEPEDESDADFQYKSPAKGDADGDSEGSEVQSWIPSSQISEYSVHETSFVEESYFDKSVGSKKKLRDSNVSSLYSGSKRKKQLTED